MTYVVTFQTEPARRDDLVAKIKWFGDWGEVTPTSFLLNTNHQLRGILEMLQPMLGAKDSLAVFTISSPWSAYCDPVVEDMAEALLGKCEDYVPKDWNGVDRS